ncbi:MAG TPA: carboxypeptidase-like regulatory domain-containing protein [Vicinamibacterales bacterium]|nr:carboxypeptidase-like regulatory domain-containing protein [Vicinamibacterales bacterium]
MGVSVLRSSVRAGLCAALLLGATTLAWGQAGTGSLTGTVRDSQRAVLPGATVTATNTSTGAVRTTVSNATGIYNIPGLPPGNYTVKFELSGFSPYVRENAILGVDTTTQVDATLVVGGIAETVTVTEATPIINTVDASVGQTMNAETIARLPVEAQNVVHLLSLQPGAVFIPVTNPNTSDPRYGSVAGARSDQQNVTLDGVDVNDPQLQAAYTSAVRVTQEALEEFRVSTSNYGAESGRSSGPQVSLVTKSGTNNFNGSGYWLGRRTRFSSNEYFTKLTQVTAGNPSEPPRLDKDIWGGSFGGPIRRNRLFFFGNFEKLKENSETPVSRGVPSGSFRDGILMYRCATAAQCPGGSVSGFTGSHSVPSGWYGLSPSQLAAIDPLGIGPSRAAATYWSQFPLPNEPGLDGRNIMDYRFSAPITNDFNTVIGRVDYRFTDNQSLFGRLNIQDDTVNGAPQFPGQEAATQNLTNNYGFAIGYDVAISSSMVNSFRYGVTAIDSATAGRQQAEYTTFRFLSNYEPITFNSSRETPTQNIVNDLSWLKGSHTFKFGTNLRFTRIPSSRESGSYNSATVNPSWVSGIGRTYMPGRASCTTPGCSEVPAVASNFAAGYADAWLNALGVLSQATVRANYDREGNAQPSGSPVTRKYATDEYEFYIQDSWRIGQSLTLTGGVRYSLYSPPYEVNGLQVAPNISMGENFDQRRANMLAGIPSTASPIVQFDLAGPKNNRRGFYDWDKNNWAPRVSAAWTPRAETGFLGWLTGGDQMVVRAGYSKVFDRIGQGLALNFDQGFAFGMSTTISSPFGAPYETNPAVRFVAPGVLPPTVPAAPPGGFPQTPPIRAGIITTSIDDTIVTPSAHMVNLIVGRELRGGFAIEGGYIGRFGRDLLVRRDLAMPLNLVDPASGVDYFTAAQQLIRATEAAGLDGNSPQAAFTALQNIPYWENLFPGATNAPDYEGLTATQAIAYRYASDAPDYITSLWLIDQFCDPACSKFGSYSYFMEQYDSLASISSIGRSNYHAMILTLRKRYSKGLQFDVNYTFSDSKDLGSNVERGSAFGNYGAGGYSGFLLNSWDPELNYGTSDFDVRHQLNTNWIWDLPFGQGRRYGGGASGFANQIIGDWSIAGLMRLTSGFPFGVINCRSCWPTNWNLQGNASLVTPGVQPETKTIKNAVDGRPSAFADPEGALEFFRFSLPGETGERNNFRGDGYFNIDLSISKAFRIGISDHRLRFRWDIFNLTNTAKFDVDSLNVFPDRSGFGRYDSTLASCDGQAGRCMQFAFRYEF